MNENRIKVIPVCSTTMEKENRGRSSNGASKDPKVATRLYRSYQLLSRYVAAQVPHNGPANEPMWNVKERRHKNRQIRLDRRDAKGI